MPRDKYKNKTKQNYPNPLGHSKSSSIETKTNFSPKEPVLDTKETVCRVCISVMEPKQLVLLKY